MRLGIADASPAARRAARTDESQCRRCVSCFHVSTAAERAGAYGLCVLQRAAPASDSAPTAVEAPASDSAPTRGSGSDISERSICSVCPLSKRMVSVDGVLVRASCACAWSRPTLYMSVTVRNSPTRLTLPLTTRSTPYPWLPVSHPVPHTPHVSLAGAVRGLSLQT